jgi:hypothetical protein
VLSEQVFATAMADRAAVLTAALQSGADIDAPSPWDAVDRFRSALLDPPSNAEPDVSPEQRALRDVLDLT